MKQALLILILAALLGTCALPVAGAHNPFTSRPETQHRAPEPPFKSEIFVKIILWQHQLKAAMADLIRASEARDGAGPLLALLGLAFLYGAVHAAGPGHGKVVATSYVLTRRATIPGGILLGFCIAVIHGLSGVVGVLGLHYLLQRSVSDTLASATTVTQIVSFGLITCLGLGIFLKHGYALLSGRKQEQVSGPEKPTSASLLPWAAAVGLVPCPAVVMVMLFCLSMEALVLGLCLAACICLGMAVTISSVVVAVIAGKTGVLHIIPPRRAVLVEGVLGGVSGAAIAVFGLLLLLSAINAAFY